VRTTPETVEEVSQAIQASERVRAAGGGTKSAMSCGAGLSLRKLSGIVDYTPQEFTFTARAGTPLAEVRDLLARHGQYLPFDPVLVEAGGTVGGTIASGLSGPGRQRFGGVRDFLLGVRFVTGTGEVHSGGGKVVKNAAGFDFPKLMVGARGRFGILVEATFKVFPRPAAYATILADGYDPDGAADAVRRLGASSLELACLDYEPPGRLLLRIGGLPESLPRRIERTREFLSRDVETLHGEEDEAVWREAREFLWQPEDATLVKVPLTPSQIEIVDRTVALACPSAARRYSVGGNVLWLAWPNRAGVEPLREALARVDRNGVAVRGEPWGLVGEFGGGAFAQRLASVLDPAGRLQGADPAPVG
jgi:glycolate oxidase FAD binding subunit